MMNWEPFTANDFDIFQIEGFDARMEQIRKHVSPKLKLLGDMLAPGISAAAETPLHSRIALHIRRRVNPPEETWVAFSPTPKSYKPFIHLRLAINAQGIRYLCFLEDEAKDKTAFADAMRSKASFLLRYFKSNPDIICYDILSEHGEPQYGKDVDLDRLLAFSLRLSRIKNQHAVFGIFLPRYSKDIGIAESFMEISTRNLSKTLPLFHLLDKN